MSPSTHKTSSPSFRAKRGISLFFLFMLPAFGALPAPAQVQTGTPPFGSYGGGPDIINLANLNAQLTVPVLHKPGRGLNFDYDLDYNSSVWYPVGSGGNQSWVPVFNWGWMSTWSGTTGYLT